MLVVLSIGSLFARHFGHRGEGRLIAAVFCSLPFILVRLAYSAVSAFGHDSTFNIVNGSVTVMLLTVVLEEIAVVAIYTITGLKLEIIPKHQQSQSGGKDLMYRAGRGDFGTSNLGILSLLTAVVGEITKPAKMDADYQEKTPMPEV